MSSDDALYDMAAITPPPTIAVRAFKERSGGTAYRVSEKASDFVCAREVVTVGEYQLVRVVNVAYPVTVSVVQTGEES